MIKKTVQILSKPLVVFLVLGLVLGSVVSSQADTKFTPKIKQAMAEMKNDCAKLGPAKVDGGNLLFGTTKINDNFALVDSLKAKYNCTATFFVKKGDAFMRVSTNVMKDGKRAVGTPLDPSGPAIAAIRQGKAHHGIVDILGKMYDTGYEPIKNAAGETVGVYYIGFPLE
ncbi:MAG: hypothetical protein A2512_07685 [Deltaproteobacteria bacterium RIFOXYD12_FULL_56_24]|nr:MAG: hypothetical protein A2512_07685 [Deltaproteobacteria bacterium RIFOXYD12_FULL_56_24]